MSAFFEFMRVSFWHVLPILVAGAFALAIMIERYRALFKIYPLSDVQGFFDKVTDFILNGKLGEAISHCDRYPMKPMAQVTKQALLRAHQPDNLIEQGIELAVGEWTSGIQKRTTFLATIANVATLLGLFGTIAGLINSFQAIGHADPQQKATLLATGISQAMNATLLGLGVAIPCMIAFSFLMNRTNRLIGEIDHSAVKILDILKQRYYAAEFESLNPQTSQLQPEEEGDEDEAPLLHKSNSKPANLRRAA
ncbi:MAG: MotA/TolQ/ExbB proton channel family protein [Bdellovibrio sp.]|nr:MotA/TolQ/ExbB proton channel family protein [Bdellovibrio sp.]